MSGKRAIAPILLALLSASGCVYHRVLPQRNLSICYYRPLANDSKDHQREQVYFGPFSGEIISALTWSDLQKERKRLEARMRTAVEAYLAQHPDIPPDLQRCMLEPSIAIGFTTDQVEFFWGKPDARTQYHPARPGPYGADERWVYRLDWDIQPISVYLARRHVYYIYLNDGVVVGLEESGLAINS